MNYLDYLCRILGFFMAFAGIYSLVVFLPAVWNFKGEDDDRNF